MPIGEKQQTSQQPNTLVFTSLDSKVVSGILEKNGIAGELEYRRIPKSIVNTSMFARVMALRVVRYGHPIVLDANIRGMDALEITSAIPEQYRDNVTVISQDGHNLPSVRYTSLCRLRPSSANSALQTQTPSSTGCFFVQNCYHHLISRKDVGK